MAKNTIPVVGGALLGLGPTVFLTGAVAAPWIFSLGAAMIVAGTAITLTRQKPARDLAMGIAGLSGGIAMALANLFYPAGPQAFPGGPGLTWVAAMLMFGGATPILHPVHREHASLRALATTAGIVEDDAE